MARAIPSPRMPIATPPFERQYRGQPLPPSQFRRGGVAAPRAAQGSVEVGEGSIPEPSATLELGSGPDAFMIACVRCRWLPWVAFALAALPIRTGAAESEAESRVAMPEPLLNETTTDLDSDEAGELEFDLTGGAEVRRSLRASSLQAEVEWRVTRRLGLSLELGLANDPGAEPFGARLAASWALLHDLQHDIHLQLFADGRFPLAADAAALAVDPSESALPFELGVHAGVRRGWLTVRGQVAGELGGHSAHLVPARAALALLAGGRAGFGGVELMSDWARADPFAVAAEVIGDGALLGLPLRLALGVPWRPSLPGALGIQLRLMAELD